jgi:FSR family fosmidomycin resistance protein-like MFS transporter
MSGRLRSLMAVANPREVGLLSVAHGVNEFYSVALPPILPLLVADFGVGYDQLGVLITVYFVVYSIFQLPAGRLADRFGQRLLLAAGMVVLSAGILVLAFAPDFQTLLVGEIIAGVGGSTYHPAGMSLISDIESGTTEGTAMGVHGLGGVAGTALAPALIGGLAAVRNWRFALIVAAGVGVVYTLIFLLLFSDVDGSGEGEGGGGSAERTTATADGGSDEVSSPTDSTAAPATPANGLTTRLGNRLGRALNVPLESWVLVLFLTNFATSLELNAVRTFATSYLFERTAATGLSNLVFFVMLVGAGIASLGAGRLADRVDRVWLGVAAMAASAVMLAGTVFVPAEPLLLVGWFFVVGVTMYAVYPALNAITSARSEREFSGSLFAVTLTAGSLGGAAGPTLFGYLAAELGMERAFPAIAGMGVAAAVLFLVLKRV